MIVRKSNDIYGQVLFWIIDLNLNRDKPVTDRDQFRQEISAGKQVCRCYSCLGRRKVDSLSYPQGCQIHIQEHTTMRKTSSY